MATQTATFQLNNATSMKASNTAAAPKPAERIRPYKDFLTPALHRRFTRSTLFLLTLCYVESLLFRTPSSFLFFNPVGLVGVRALLLLGPCLAVFIVRVANIHIGERPSTSGIATLQKALTSLRTAHTVAWYAWSAWFFSEVYIWSRGAEDHLSWVDPGQEYERARLNENPIFLRCYLFSLGLVQAALHLRRDYDRVNILANMHDTGSEQSKTSSPGSLETLVAGLPVIGVRVFNLSGPGLPIAVAAYFSSVRYFVWPYFHAIGRTLNRDLSPTSRPTGIGIDFVFLLVWQCFSSAAMLVSLWEISNAIFSINVCQPPLKRDQPLTSELKDAQGAVVSKSKDPNASLLTGLRSKKEVINSFAFWELWLICSDFEARRKTIYAEVDRKDGSTWSQIAKICLDEIEAIPSRIKRAKEPTEAKQADHVAKESVNSGPEQQKVIPRIADRKVLDGDVWRKSKPTDLMQSFGQMAKSIGQSPGTGNPLSPRARRAVEWGREHMIPKSAQDKMSYKALTQDADGLAMQFLRTPPGGIFREKFGRVFCSIAFGSPDSRRTNIALAAKSLVRLTVCSLKEDNYGQVAKSVPAIIRSFTAAINSLNSFALTLPPHWTDIDFTQRDRAEIPEKREVVYILRNGLEEVLLAFSEYASAIGVTKLDLRQAQEAMGKGNEMRKL